MADEKRASKLLSSLLSFRQFLFSFSSFFCDVLKRNISGTQITDYFTGLAFLAQKEVTTTRNLRCSTLFKVTCKQNAFSYWVLYIFPPSICFFCPYIYNSIYHELQFTLQQLFLKSKFKLFMCTDEMSLYSVLGVSIFTNTVYVGFFFFTGELQVGSDIKKFHRQLKKKS